MAIKVSVIVPVYNPGPYIEDCIASILRQSLPSDEYEAIFVDDGSTDGTGARLDAVAEQHDHVRSLHIPNSGWPGRPRNVGIDAAAGRYVYFVDNDDWIGDEALERLYERAERNEADIVVGKIVGHGPGKYVPRYQFARNVDDASLADGGLSPPLLGLLSPHKLFRRSFLDEHGIRFPEGRRRLEDHVFVMRAFFKARRMSIMADYPCYHWMRREDATNASFNRADPVVYYRAVRDVLDVIDDNTEPGPERDRLYLHWYRSNMLMRMHGRSWAEGTDPYVQAMFAEIHRLALERFGPGVTKLLSSRFRVLSRSLMAGRLDLVSAQAAIEQGLRADVELDAIEQTSGSLRLSVAATMRYADGSPIRLTRHGDRMAWDAPPRLTEDPTILEEDLDVTSEIGRTTMSIVLRHRESMVEYELPAAVDAPAHGDDDGAMTISPRGQADIDLATIAAGAGLTTGVWDIFVDVRSCGWSSTRRLSRVGGIPVPGSPTVDPYTTLHGNLSLKVNEFAPPQPTLPPAAAPAPRAPPPADAVRSGTRLRDLLKRVLPKWARRKLRGIRSR